MLSFIIPSLQSEWISNLFITQRVHQTIYTAVNPQIIYQIKATHNPVTLGQIITCVYLTGTLLFLSRLAYRLLRLKKLISKNEGNSTAFSFFNKIKVGDNIANKQTILSHEEVHAQQWHSADVLLIEAVMIVNWFNPIVYFYRKAIKHVHEYIADRKAIQTGTSKADYALILLSQTFGTFPHELSNAFFNHSMLKQRLKMLNQNESHKRALLKYGLSAPLFAAMLIFSSATVNNSNIVKIINKATAQAFAINHINFSDGVSEAQPDAATEPAISISTLKAGISQGKQTHVQGITATGHVPHSDSLSAQNSAPVFNAVEIQPEFPGGDAAFNTFLRENISYPAQAKDNHVTGRVYVQFVIEKDGTLSDMKVLREPGGGLGDEAARVLTMSPKWSPGIQNGRTVRVQYTVPVNFSLADDNEKKVTVKDSALGNNRPSKIMNILTVRSLHTDSVAKYINAKNNQIVTITNVPLFKAPDATFVINGKQVMRDEFNRLNADDIESVSVVKADTTKGKNENGKGTIYIKLKKTKANHF